MEIWGELGSYSRLIEEEDCELMDCLRPKEVANRGEPLGEKGHRVFLASKWKRTSRSTGFMINIGNSCISKALNGPVFLDANRHSRVDFRRSDVGLGQVANEEQDARTTSVFFPRQPARESHSLPGQTCEPSTATGARDPDAQSKSTFFPLAATATCSEFAELSKIFPPTFC